MMELNMLLQLILLVGWKWLFYYLITMCLPYIQSFYLVIGALYLFIPIMGRSGSSINSEVVMANMLCILFSLLLSFTVNCLNYYQNESFRKDCVNVI